MLRLSLLALLLVPASGCTTRGPAPGPALPNGPQAQALGLRATWTAFQDAVRKADGQAIAALWRADAPALPVPGSGATGEALAEALLRALAGDAELRQAILTTRAQDLRADGLVRTFSFERSSVDPHEGTEYESGMTIYFVVDPADARVSLVDVLLAG